MLPFKLPECSQPLDQNHTIQDLESHGLNQFNHIYWAAVEEYFSACSLNSLEKCIAFSDKRSRKV